MSRSIDNDDVALLTFMQGNPGNGGWIEQMFFKNKDTGLHDFQPVWVGIDWAADSGMLRGDVIKREGNVIYLRFKTWEIGDETK